MINRLVSKYLPRLEKSKVIIYLFHGVINQESKSLRNYTNKHILANDFEALISSLSTYGNPISMDEVLSSCIDSKPFKDYSYAITFDDGFENNLSVAIPILKRYKTPATFYVTTKFINEGALSWVDKIESYIASAANQAITIPAMNEEFTVSSLESRLYLMSQIRSFVKNNPLLDANDFSESLCDIIKLKEEPMIEKEIDSKLTWEELRLLSKEPLATVGGHSHTHRIMNYLNDKELDLEIKESLRLLNEMASINTHHYSYPEGHSSSFSENVINVLKSYNIKICPTAIDGSNSSNADPFTLKRVMVY